MEESLEHSPVPLRYTHTGTAMSVINGLKVMIGFFNNVRAARQASHSRRDAAVTAAGQEGIVYQHSLTLKHM